VLRPVGTDIVEYEAITERGPIKIELPNSATFLMSNGQMYDDMCDMDVLNEPEILNNLVERYKSSKIFTFIGPTLIVINPYRIINEYFSNEAMLRIRDKILNGSTST
jgi:myosin heavy subunit